MGSWDGEFLLGRLQLEMCGIGGIERVPCLFKTLSDFLLRVGFVLHTIALLHELRFTERILNRIIHGVSLLCEHPKLRTNISQQEDPAIGSQGRAEDGVIPPAVKVRKHEQGDPGHPDGNGEEHREVDVGPMSLPAREGTTEGEGGHEEGQRHQEEDIDEQEDKVFVATRSRKLRKDIDIGPIHGQDNIFNSDDILDEAEAHGETQNHEQGEGLPPPDELGQIESMSQQAGEADGEEDPKEEEACGPCVPIQSDDEGKGEAKDAQHTQEEEKLSREHFSPVGVLHLADEEWESKHEGHRGHNPGCGQRF